MFSDPLVVTYDGVSKSLARGVGYSIPPVQKTLAASSYSTSDGEFIAQSVNTQLARGYRASEFYLGRMVIDNDSNAFNNVSPVGLANYVGLTVVTNGFRHNIDDVSKLRAAVDSLLTPSLFTRLMNGEV